MKQRLQGIVLGCALLGSCVGVGATDRYVSLTGGHVSPFTSWADAATNIQAAIDAASASDVVWVTNGVYSIGGKAMVGNLINRVAIDKPVTVRSVNGYATTTIQGVGPAGNSAVRCAWLTNGATLIGFTLRGGATRTFSDDTYVSGGGVWCTSTNESRIANCMIVNNTAYYSGGGCYQGTLENCGILYNSAGAVAGGGVYKGSLRNCFVIGNSSINGGGTYNCVVNSCTVVSNSAAGTGGGNYGGKLTNCIVYFNSPNNTSSSACSYCCVTPLPSGSGNISSDPQLLNDSLHISSTSPCRGAGTNLVSGADIDGQTWTNPPSIGCDDWQPRPAIVFQPTIHSTGATIGFAISVTVIGQEPFWYGWTRNGVPIEDDPNYAFSHTTNLIVRSASLIPDGLFQVVVSNAFGMVTSTVAQLSVRFVDATGTTPTPPYTSWVTAATNIQDAIDAAVPGELVLVTNGTYGSGGKVLGGDLTNRVAVDKAIIVQSINGADSAIIQGVWNPTVANGSSAVRCAWLTNGACLSGFTLRGGATRQVTTSPNEQMNGGGVWGISTNATVYDCLIVSNTASYWGGGAYQVAMSRCTLTGNRAVGSGIAGGGVAAAGTGGGAMSCTLYNCVITGNFADQSDGGGVVSCNSRNCIITKNSSYLHGGGVIGGTLVNCTISGNISSGYSPGYGAAVWGAVLTNCIIWGNVARTTYPDTNYTYSTLAYCCSIPLPPGDGNISLDPQLLADGGHLAETSPCRAAGLTNVVAGTDTDGQPWTNPPAIGADEWWPTPLFAVQPRPLGISRPLALNLGGGVIAGKPPSAISWIKDGAVLEDNGHYSSAHTSNLVVHSFGPMDAGNYWEVVSNAFGMATSAVAQVVVHCVNVAGSTPAAPFSTWDTAAVNIQDAVDAAAEKQFVLVTNGVYSAGGKVIGGLTNRVALTKPITLFSINGPSATVIQGQWDPATTKGPAAVRCAWLANESVLDGFTLRDGATTTSADGGGAWCVSNNVGIANCVITNCRARYGGGVYRGTLDKCTLVDNAASWGGGAYFSALWNCWIARNSAINYGGGAYAGTLYNCAITENYSAFNGGGAHSCDFLINCTVSRNSAANLGGGLGGTSATNCIIYFNSAPFSPNGGAAAYSCSSVLGLGNISTDPQLVDGLHLSVTSPCRGMGSSLYVIGADLDGQAWASPPSMGCDEVYESDLIGPLSVSLSAAYPEVAAYGIMPLTGQITGRASRLSWSFGDGPTYTNLSYVTTHAWTNPGDYTVTLTAFNTDNPGGVSTNLLVHVVPLVSPALSVGGWSNTTFRLSFAGQPGVTYVVEQATNLSPPVTWQTVQTLASTGALMQATDSKATNAMRFYRARTQ